MKFKEFAEKHGIAWKGVKFDVGLPGWVDIARLWNGLAILFPEKIDELIIWDIGTDPRLGLNIFRKDVAAAIKKARDGEKNKAKINVETKTEKNTGAEKTKVG